MFIQQIYTACLSEAAYYVESEGKAAVIDPMRDIEGILELANERKAKITHIFETHFHADFVSGHLDLSKATGAPIIYGPGTQTSFPVTVAKDGEQFPLGKLHIEVLHTPGHTLESTCYLVKKENGQPVAVFTGDTLFVGDVGRPDLSQKGKDLTAADLAGMLYDSIHSKLTVLPDEVIVYPAHGAGSSCGKNLGTETQTTIGEQKSGNYALKAASKKEFIDAVLDGLGAPPAYFPVNVHINKHGYESLDEILSKALQPLDPLHFKQLLKTDVIILDTRPATAFVEAHLPGALFIGLEGRFAEWAGSLLPFDKEIVLVTEPGKERESVIRLARVGFSKIIGYLEGGMESWTRHQLPIDLIINVEADELAMDLPFDENLVVMDVRKPTEFAAGHVKEAINLPLEDLKDPGSMSHLEETLNFYVHCAGGYRSVIAASMLKKQGIHNIRNVEGGWNAILNEERIPIVK
jgi:glyoxylase-like metal-dependent hydrolase (beta-lactamase superfamily II)/rhodanese-related sulfurtransferase